MDIIVNKEKHLDNKNRNELKMDNFKLHSISKSNVGVDHVFGNSNDVV